MGLLSHTDFQGAFTPGAVFLRGEDEWVMETERWGTLVTPTGRLVASDALSPERVKPFKRTVAPGQYPVELAWNGGSTCAMRVRFSKRKSTHWESALRVGEKPPSKNQVLPPCFGVDSGVAGIFDLKAARIAGKDETWSSRVGKGADHVHELDPKTGASMVWCHSGNGDGGYPSFWGFDNAGGITELILDFLVLVEGVHDEHTVMNLPEKVGTELDDLWFLECGCTNVRLTWSKRTKELRVEYSRADSLEITLLNGCGKAAFRGYSGGGGSPVFLRYDVRKIDLDKESRAKLVFRRFAGMRSLPRR